MSKENLQAFYQEYRIDPKLQEQLEGIVNPSDYAKKAVSLGLEKNLEFTVAEVKEALDDPAAFLEETFGEELSDMELGIVAGGIPYACDKS